MHYPHVFCPYSLYSQLKGRYSKRVVSADMHIAPDRYYYWTRDGRLREVHVKDNSVWTTIRDEDGYPTDYIKRIR